MSMKVELKAVGKRYRKKWVFQHLNLELNPGDRLSIKGHNGAGKSTLLRIIAGQLLPSAGSVEYFYNHHKIEEHSIYKNLSIAAPYMELIEELTLLESIRLHRQFKPFVQGILEKDLIDILGFQKETLKQIKHFSSGMKQRLKIALSLYSKVDMVLLDEPTTNLDEKGIAWFQEHLKKQIDENKILVIASNVSQDFLHCEKTLEVENFKPNPLPHREKSG